MKKSQTEIDRAIEVLLPCDTKREWELALAKLASELQWGEPDAVGRRDGDPIDRMMWGLVTRVQEYLGPETRTSRAGLGWTFAEIQLIKDAIFTRRQGKIKISNTYLARFFQRPESEIEVAINQYGPAQGRTGFNLL